MKRGWKNEVGFLDVTIGDRAPAEGMRQCRKGDRYRSGPETRDERGFERCPHCERRRKGRKKRVE